MNSNTGKNQKNVNVVSSRWVSDGGKAVVNIFLALIIIIPATLLGGLMYLYSLQPQY